MSLMVALKSRVLWGERCYGMLHYNFNSMEQERRTSDKSFVCTGVYKSYWLAPRSFSSGSLSRALRRSLTPCTRAFLHLPIFLDHRNLIISPSSCSVSKHSKFKKKKKYERIDFSMKYVTKRGGKKWCVHVHSATLTFIHHIDMIRLGAFLVNEWTLKIVRKLWSRASLGNWNTKIWY